MPKSVDCVTKRRENGDGVDFGLVIADLDFLLTNKNVHETVMTQNSDVIY